MNINELSSLYFCLFMQLLAIKDELLKASYTIATDRNMQCEKSTHAPALSEYDVLMW